MFFGRWVLDELMDLFFLWELLSFLRKKPAIEIVTLYNNLLVPSVHNNNALRGLRATKNGKDTDKIIQKY